MKVKGIFSLLLIALMFGASPAMEAGEGPPSCKADSKIAPEIQTVPELDNNGAPTVVTLNGEPSKPDPAPGVTYSWQQTSGPTVTLSVVNVEKPTFTVPSVGPDGATLKFELTVTATGCNPATATFITTINVTNVETNLPPVASATVLPNPVTEGGLVTLDGSSSSDPDGDTLTYAWEQLTGTPVTLNYSSDAIATFTAPNDAYPDGESLTFRLTVSDGYLTNSTDKIVNIVWVNDPPVAVVTCPETVNEGAIVTLDGGGSSDSDDSIASHAWDQLEGLPNADLNGVDLSSPNLSFTAPQLTSTLNTMKFKLTVSDNGGLISSAECLVMVLDVTPPVISGVDAVTAEATGPSGAAVSYANPTATDLVDGTVPVTCTPASGSTFPLGTTTVRCSASDKAGNTASASFTVKVKDTTPPTISGLPANITAEATGPSGAALSYANPTATDLVDGVVVVTCAPLSGSTFPLGTTTVNCSAKDNAGNTASASFTVKVQDTTPPTISGVPANITAEATGPSGAAVTYSNPTATDLVSGTVPVTCTIASGSTFPLGTTTVNCSASDNAGNTASASFKISVIYNWSGFFQPIDNLPAVNAVKAGSAIPVKFGLGGNMGLDIFASGYPRSVVIADQVGAEDTIEETVTAGGSSLTYDPIANQYVYVWKTDKTWATQSRQLQVKLKDGTDHVANFKFK